MKEQTAIRRPFTTTNRALAIALASVGVPPHEEGGMQIPCLNTYTPDILRGIETSRQRAGLPDLHLKGRPLEEAIKIAYRAGAPGKVEYCFQDTPTLRAVHEGWAEQSAIIEAAERGTTDGNAQSKTGNLMVSPEVAGRLFCQYFKMGQEIEGKGKKPPLWMALLPLADRSEMSSQGDALCSQTPAQPGTRVEPRAGLESTGSVNLRSVKV